MREAKIQFSAAETELMCNTDMILTKNSILLKIKFLFESLQHQMVEEASQHYSWSSHPVFQMPPKISRGENYLGLPYLVLDYPRQFDSINVFAIRTMFWWGHFFSSTLQLSGQFKTEFIAKIEEAGPALGKNNYFIGINEDPWVHHFEVDNYRKINRLNEEMFIQYCRQFDHMKIAAHWSLWDAHFAAEELLESWRFFVKLCLD